MAPQHRSHAPRELDRLDPDLRRGLADLATLDGPFEIGLAVALLDHCPTALDALISEAWVERQGTSLHLIAVVRDSVRRRPAPPGSAARVARAVTGWAAWVPQAQGPLYLSADALRRLATRETDLLRAIHSEEPEVAAAAVVALAGLSFAKGRLAELLTRAEAIDHTALDPDARLALCGFRPEAARTGMGRIGRGRSRAEGESVLPTASPDANEAYGLAEQVAAPGDRPP